MSGMSMGLVRKRRRFLRRGSSIRREGGVSGAVSSTVLASVTLLSVARGKRTEKRLPTPRVLETSMRVPIN